LFTWEPIAIDELQALVAAQFESCLPAQKAFFSACRVEPYAVPFERSGELERVWVVAELPAGLLYYEDVEEGFEIGRLDADGVLHDNGCNQLDLSAAMIRWGS